MFRMASLAKKHPGAALALLKRSLCIYYPGKPVPLEEQRNKNSARQ
jgi:hypothetical protein